MRIILFCIAFSVSFSFTSDVHAEVIGISIDQTIFNFDLDPGTEKEFTIKAQSISNEVQQVNVSAQDFSAEDNNKITLLDGPNELYGMKGWIDVKEENVHLDPGSLKELQFKVTVPADATVGSHFAVINIRALPKIDAENFQKPIVSGQIAVYVLLNVKGDITAKGTISNFSAPVFASDKVALQSEFQNTGNVFYIPYGEVKIENVVTGSDTKIKTEKHFVFPGKKYSFDMQWVGSSIFGIYKAQASFVDGEGAVHSSERYIFGKLSFVFPLGIIILILVTNKIIIKYKRKGASLAKKQQ